MSKELVEVFNGWINGLAEDAKTLQAGLEAAGTPRDAKRFLVGGLSYLLRKIDIVPDYLSGVGLVDDCAVLRISAALASNSGLGSLDGEVAGKIKALGESTPPLEEFLGELFDKLKILVAKMPDEPVRARTADKVLDDPDAYKQFLREVKDELDNYVPTVITDEERSLRELYSFFKAKLGK